MKRKIILALIFSAVCTLVACGNDDAGTVDSMNVNEGTVNEATENTPDTAQTDVQNGYIITTTTTTVAVDEFGNPIIETSPEMAEVPEGALPETPDAPVPEEPVNANPEVPAEQPTEIVVSGTPASTATPSINAPTPDEYNYGPAPYVYNIDGITYIDGVLIANKSYSLPADFYPELDSTCYNQFCKLQNDAMYEGLNIYLSSGFRSYDTQDYIYNDYVARDGQAMADTYSARPGYSEHQSGLAIDVNQIDDSFIGTPEAIWLENHCYEYGFILRYPQGKQNITGYKYESWHIRYVGTDMSYKIHDKAMELGDPYLTLEEYFGIDSYYH